MLSQSSRHRCQRRYRPLRAEFLEPRTLLTLVPQLVADINMGRAGVEASDIVDVGGVAYFGGGIVDGDLELWRSDGTPNGTYLVRDIFVGDQGSGAAGFTRVGGTVFFIANDGKHGVELWKTDGTGIGTVLVKDIYDGPFQSRPRYLTNVNGTLFFSARSPNTGYELWKSDGTAAGTVLVKDINPKPDGLSSAPQGLTNINGVLYFSAFDGDKSGVWKSDGTTEGTVLVSNFTSANGSRASDLTNVNGTLMFAAESPVEDYSLWKSDGTAAGTVVVVDFPGDGSTRTKPTRLTNVNGTLFFNQDDLFHGQELWKSDGSAAGTVIVKDIRPGNAQSSSPKYLSNIGGTLFFTATDGINGVELWRSDGSDAGTMMVKDIAVVNIGSSNPKYLTNVGGTLYFRANDGAHGIGLWKSDGTDAGTVLVRSGAADGAYPTNLTNVNGKLFFAARDETARDVLWTSDGTTAGTTRLSLNRPIDSSPSDFVVINGIAYFTADDGFHGRELWRTNGVPVNTFPVGTSLVQDIFPGAGGSYPSDLTNINGTLYFRASDGQHGVELWKSDGTRDGTVIVADIAAGGGSYPGNLIPAGGTLYFTASAVSSGSTTRYGPSPYLSSADSPFDLSQLGTNFWLEDFEDGLLNTPGVSALGGVVRAPGGLTDSVDADDGSINGDGHLGHSYLVRPGISGVTFTFDSQALGGLPSYVGLVSTGGDSFGLPVQFFDAGGNLIATLNDQTPKPANGATSDDRFSGVYHAGGISRVIVQNVATGGAGFELDHLQYGSIVQSVGSFALWKSDGTPEGTVLVQDIGYEPQFSAVSDGATLYFTGKDAAGIELWKTDGGGTGRVLDINPGQASSNPRLLASIGGSLYFAANDGTNGEELWKSNGAGIGLLKDINPGPGGSNINFVADLNGILVFDAVTSASGDELWKSDGSTNGTMLVKDIRGGVGSSSPKLLTRLGSAVYFIADDGAHGVELWTSDGSGSGTSLVRDVLPGSSGSRLNSLAALNSKLFFSAVADDNMGFEPWISDGTNAGTFATAEIAPGAAPSAPETFAAIGNSIVLTAIDGTHGRELWTLVDINAAPVFTKGGNVAVTDEQPVLLSIPNWALAISAGPPDEAAQQVTFVVSNDSNGLFSQQPKVDPKGTLTFTPLPNVEGTATVTVKLQDDGGTASGGVDTSGTQTFIIDVKKPHRWHNEMSPYAPINRGGMEVLFEDEAHTITPTDVLLIVNYLNAGLPAKIPDNALIANGTTRPFYDVDADHSVTPTDALLIVNLLNAGQGGPTEGEGEASDVSQPPHLDAFFQELGSQAINQPLTPNTSQTRNLAGLIAALADATSPSTIQRRRR